MKKPDPFKPVVEIFEIEQFEQYSPEWWQVRRGLPTASCFAAILAGGVGREKYLRVLAGEILTNEVSENGGFTTAAMQRGKDMEAEAFAYYESRHFQTVRRVAFMRRTLPSGRYVGASPDGLVGHHKGLEIKTMRPDLLIERLQRGAGMPPEHKAQVQGEMWVGDLEEMDVLLFYRGMPIVPKYNIKRDETYIKTLSNAVEVFDWEVNELVKMIRKMAG